MIKFFHTADIHLGVENYGKIDPNTGIHSRLLDFQNSFEQCIELAIKEKIDFFLFCGDAYKTAFPTPTQQKIFIQPLLKLQNAKIPIINIVGNHDNPLSFGKINSLEILNYLSKEKIHIFSKPEILNLETKNGPIQIVGIPWPTRNNILTKDKFHLKNSNEIIDYLSQVIGEIIQDFAKQLNPKIPAILTGHLTVSSGVFSGSEKRAVFGNDPVFLPSQLAIKPFDYIALGHLHRHQNLNPKGYPSIVYSGSIEKIDFGERNDKKGFCSVKIDSDEKNKCSFEFIPLKTRPMIQIEVKLNTDKDQTEQILDEIEKYNISGAILKIIYHVPNEKKDKVDLKKIQQTCNNAMHLVSITPIRQITKREKRASLKISMNLETLLRKYFESKDYSYFKKNKLLEKAQKIYFDVFQKEEESSEEHLDIKKSQEKSLHF